MPIKASGRARNWRGIDNWSGGTGWLAYPEESMQRASHALRAGEPEAATGSENGSGASDDVWLVDPVDFDGLDDMLDGFGAVRGAVVLLDRHKRDADVIARRHDVPVFVPDWMDGVVEELQAPVERFHRDLPDSEYAVHELIDNRFWQEGVLYGEDSKTLVVPEALGTNDYYRTEGERLGVNPILRLTPPRKLQRLRPERILVGHGTGIFHDATAALDDALNGARRRAPRLYVDTVRDFLL